MKTKLLLRNLVFTGILILISIAIQAQARPDTLTYNIETIDGNTYTGKIIEQDEEKVMLNSYQVGEITLYKRRIKSIMAIEPGKMKNGKYWADNPQATRYFFSPNGYGLKAGEGYYQNVWVLFNSFAVGLTDNISLGAGIVPLFLLGGISTPVWITPKFSIPVSKDKFSLGGGALLGTVLLEDNTGFGIVYGIGTVGSKDKNVSLGLGYGFAAGDWAKSPLININVMLRTGARGYFISENYYIRTADTDAALLSFGGRHIFKKAGLDYGLIIPLSSEMESFIAIPWLGLTLPFGKKQVSESALP